MKHLVSELSGALLDAAVALAEGKSLPDGSRFRYIEHHAQTPLIAAMRAYVASRFGETVELP